MSDLNFEGPSFKTLDLCRTSTQIFQKMFYGNINPDRLILTEQGCPSISNPEGLQTFPQKPQKEIGILIKEFYFT